MESDGPGNDVGGGGRGLVADVCADIRRERLEAIWMMAAQK